MDKNSFHIKSHIPQNLCKYLLKNEDGMEKKNSFFGTRIIILIKARQPPYNHARIMGREKEGGCEYANEVEN